MDRALQTRALAPSAISAVSPGVAVFLVSLDATVMVAAFSALRIDFAAVSAGMLSWTLNAHTIVYAALLVTAGRMATPLARPAEAAQ